MANRGLLTWVRLKVAHLELPLNSTQCFSPSRARAGHYGLLSKVELVNWQNWPKSRFPSARPHHTLLLLKVQWIATAEHPSKFVRSLRNLQSQRGEMYIISLLGGEHLEAFCTAVASLSCDTHAPNSNDLTGLSDNLFSFSSLLIIFFRVMTGLIYLGIYWSK